MAYFQGGTYGYSAWSSAASGYHQRPAATAMAYTNSCYKAAAPPPLPLLSPSCGSPCPVVGCFQMADQNTTYFNKEMKRAMPSFYSSFDPRLKHLLVHVLNVNPKMFGQQDMSSAFQMLQQWRGIFERFDRDRNGRIDFSELQDAFWNLGLSVSPVVMTLLLYKFDKSQGANMGICFESFVECCLTVKGLTDKFREMDPMNTGTACFTYDNFLMDVLPFIVA